MARKKRTSPFKVVRRIPKGKVPVDMGRSMAAARENAEFAAQGLNCPRSQVVLYKRSPKVIEVFVPVKCWRGG